MSKTEQNEGRGSAFKLVHAAGHVEIIGPDGLWLYNARDAGEATAIRVAFDMVFSMGRNYERGLSEKSRVPGPQNPPRPFHPRECG